MRAPSFSRIPIGRPVVGMYFWVAILKNAPPLTNSFRANHFRGCQTLRAVRSFALLLLLHINSLATRLGRFHLLREKRQPLASRSSHHDARHCNDASHFQLIGERMSKERIRSALVRCNVSASKYERVACARRSDRATSYGLAQMPGARGNFGNYFVRRPACL